MRALALFLLAVAMTVTPTSSAPIWAADEFTLERYFRGQTIARGSFRAINGVGRDFTVKLHGAWDGKTLSLKENFVFDDGTRDQKTWRFVKTGPGTYRGSREDVIGETSVRIDGNVARFTYLVYLDAERRKNRVRFHDTMTLRTDGTVLNTAWVTKFGFPVALTRVEFRRP